MTKKKNHEWEKTSDQYTIIIIISNIYIEIFVKNWLNIQPQWTFMDQLEDLLQLSSSEYLEGTDFSNS